MKLAYFLLALALVSVALPVASAGHTVPRCMSVWDPAPPPGWENVCVTSDWLVGHNPFLPLAQCLAGGVFIVGYDVAEGLACLA